MAWIKVLQYGEVAYTPTANAAGKLEDAPSTAGFAKMADVDINAIAADASGYHYYKLTSSKSPEMNTIFVRTKSPYSDTTKSFGWIPYSVCQLATKELCDTALLWKDILQN